MDILVDWKSGIYYVIPTSRKHVAKQTTILIVCSMILVIGKHYILQFQLYLQGVQIVVHKTYYNNY